MNRIGKYSEFQLSLYKFIVKTYLPKRFYCQKLKKNNNGNESSKKNEIDFNFDDLNKRLNECLNDSKEGKETEVDKNFMNFSRVQQKNLYSRSKIFTWKSVGLCFAFTGISLFVLLYLRKIRNDEREKNRKKIIGKAKIGGEWELINVDGKLEGSKDLLGNWILIYFGFTNCPDICPEEIEKMIDVVNDLDRDENPLPIIPVFISVDPARDTKERVRQYCAEFSSKLRGFTGSKEQIEKVTKAFRVYHSEGPKTNDDYIVDHTVIMYLIDPKGEFHDYYGQNRRSGEVANAIRTKALKYELEQKKSNSWFTKL